MYLPEYDKKPKFKNIILLDKTGVPELKEKRKFWVAENRTSMICSVYNIKTDRVSDKSVYLNKSGREYIKTEGKILYLDLFGEV